MATSSATYSPPSGTVNVGTASAPVLQAINSSASKVGQATTSPSGGTTTNVTGQNPQVLAAGTNTPIPGAPSLDGEGNIIPGTGSTQTANSATATNIAAPTGTTPPANLNTVTGANGATAGATSGTTGTPAGIPGLEGGTPLDNGTLSNKYNAALTGLNAGGSNAPVDQGSGSAAASNAATNAGNALPQAQDNSAINQALSQDPGYQQLLSDQQQYQSAENQTQTLSSQYQDLESQYNIPGIQTQLMNMQNVINGTEDDIRTEVTAANGFATNSQVLALSDARNKTVIQNYNQLQATLTNAQNQVNTMIGLDKEDQANALNAITTKMGIDEQVADYATKFQSNAKEGYSTIISAVGINGLYNSLMNSDPTGGALSSASQILGITPGEMKSAAATAQQSQNLDTESKQLSIESSESGLATSALARQSTALDIATKQQNLNDAAGLPDQAKAGQPGYSDTGIKYTPTTAGNEVMQNWQSQGALDKNSKIPPQYYNQGLAWWTEQGLNAADYKSIFGGYQATNGSMSKKYN